MSYRAVYWGQLNDEHLVHENPDDAIEAYLSEQFGGEDDILPDAVTVYGFKRREPNVEACVDAVLGYFLDYLDEGFGNPDKDTTEFTETMKAQTRKFVLGILSEYSVWACEFNHVQFTVKTLQWIKEKCPNWRRSL